MSGKYGDNEQIRIIDRLKAVAWREAMEAVAAFINRNWAVWCFNAFQKKLNCENNFHSIDLIFFFSTFFGKLCK